MDEDSSDRGRNGNGEGILVDRAALRGHTSVLRSLAVPTCIIAFIALILQLISVGTDELVRFSLENDAQADGPLFLDVLVPEGAGSAGGRGTSAPNTSLSVGASTNASVRVQLLPVVEATIGFTQSCYGFQCVSRDDAPPLIPLLAAPFRQTLKLGGMKPASLQNAYANLVYQFALGYDITGDTCLRDERGGAEDPEEAVKTTTSGASTSKFGIATGSLAVVFLCAATILSAYLVFLLARVNVLSSETGLYADLEKGVVRFGEHQLGIRFLMAEVTAHARLETPIVVALLIAVGFSFLWSVCSMATAVSLTQRKLRCGRSVCDSLQRAADVFFDEAEKALRSEVPYHVHCSNTVTFGTSVTAFTLSALLLFLGFAMGVVFFRSNRRGILRRRKSAMEQLTASMAGGGSATKDMDRHSSLQLLPLRQGHSYPSSHLSPLVSRQASLAVGTEAVVGIGSGAYSTRRNTAELSMHPDNPAYSFLVEQDSSGDTFTPAEEMKAAPTKKRQSHTDRLIEKHRESVEPGRENTLGGRIVMLRERKLLVREEAHARKRLSRSESKAIASLSRTFKDLQDD